MLKKSINFIVVSIFSSFGFLANAIDCDQALGNLFEREGDIETHFQQAREQVLAHPMFSGIESNRILIVRAIGKDISEGSDWVWVFPAGMTAAMGLKNGISDLNGWPGNRIHRLVVPKEYNLQSLSSKNPTRSSYPKDSSNASLLFTSDNRSIEREFDHEGTKIHIVKELVSGYSAVLRKFKEYVSRAEPSLRQALQANQNFLLTEVIRNPESINLLNPENIMEMTSKGKSYFAFLGERDPKLSPLAGYSEAYDQSMLVEANSGKLVRVRSLAGQTLKLTESSYSRLLKYLAAKSNNPEKAFFAISSLTSVLTTDEIWNVVSQFFAEDDPVKNFTHLAAQRSIEFPEDED